VDRVANERSVKYSRRYSTVKPYLAAEGVETFGGEENDPQGVTAAGAFDPSSLIWAGIGGLALLLVARALNR
jgi:hypothetical protein